MNNQQTIMLQNLWIDAARAANITQPEMYNIRKLNGCEYYWLDGACGYQIAIGNTPEETIQNAINFIAIDKAKKETGKVFISFCFD